MVYLISTVVVFSWDCHMFKLCFINQVAHGRFSISSFALSFSFCFVITATKDHGGKMVMSLAFILLSLLMLQGSGL